ncbi:MAG: orotidine-5'-phosphate decarboxylase [Spirochaetia bacterium]
MAGKHTDAGIFENIRRRSEEKDTLLCVGLDPRLPASPNITEEIVAENRRIIEATAEYAVAFKPNIAFYECHGTRGFQALADTIALVPEEVPVILDAKRGDIGSTAEAYARAVVEHFGVRAVTLSPYLGSDSVAPFLEYRELCAFILCRTSNPSATELQDLELSETGEPLFLQVADTFMALSSRIGLVAGATDGAALRALRSRFPGRWFLAPGVGAQGASAGDTVRNGADSDGGRILPVAARAIAQSDDPGVVARGFRDEISRARKAVQKRGALPPSRYSRASALAEGKKSQQERIGSASYDELKRDVLSSLIREGCFRTGQFTLKSGARSPFYVDLRKASSHPALLSRIAEAYARLAREIVFDRIAGIPVAALPLATAVSLNINMPLIYPRIPLKAHGTGNRVEGEFRPGERALLLDDLITSGKSKLEAVEVLRAEELEVSDLVVLIERGTRGRNDLDDYGVRLHSFASIRDLVDLGVAEGMISEADQERVEDYLSRES